MGKRLVFERTEGTFACNVGIESDEPIMMTGVTAAIAWSDNAELIRTILRPSWFLLDDFTTVAWADKRVPRHDGGVLVFLAPPHAPWRISAGLVAHIAELTFDRSCYVAHDHQAQFVLGAKLGQSWGFDPDPSGVEI